MKTFAGIIAYFGLVALIIWVGWNEPFRNRFLSSSDIAATERRPVVEATPVPTPRPIVRGHTALDKGRPY